MTAPVVRVVLPVLLGLAVLVAGCATHDALRLARQACGDVDSSLAQYQRSLTEPAAPQAVDQAAAMKKLRDALPLASTAAGEAPQWQALMTTLAETSRGIPESYLVGALKQQCAVAQSPGIPLGPPTTVPPQAPETRPPPVGS